MAKKKAYNLGEEIAKAAEKAKKTVEENAEKNASTIKYSGRTTPRGNKIGVGESEREKILNKYGLNNYDEKESNRIRLEFGSGPISSGVSSNANEKTTNLPYMKAVKPLDVMADVKKTAENPVTPYSRIGKNYSETTNKAYENIIDNDNNVRRKEFFADIKRLFGSYGEYTDVYTNEATRGSEYLEEKYEIAEKYSPEEIQSYLAYLYTELPKYDQARKEKLYSKEDIEDFYKEKREEWAFLGRLGDDNPYIDRGKKWDREETLKAMVPTLEVMMETAPVVEERAQQRDNAIVKYGTIVKNLEAEGYNDTYDTNKSDIPSVNGTFALSLIYHAINGKNSSGSTDTREAHTGGGNVEHMMTSGEKTIFNTLINAGKYEDAYEFYMDIQPDLEVRAREWEVKKETQYAKEHPWIAGFKTAVTNEFYEPAAFVDDVMDMIVGDGINPYDATSRGISRGQVRRQVGSEVVAEKYGTVGSYAYDGAMVMSDMVADYLTAKATGGITESMKIAKAVLYTKMFLSGYANTADSIKLRGGSDEQAILGGVLSGGIEVLTENMTWPEILEGKITDGFFKKFIKSVIPNAGEEISASVSGMVSDAIVMQDKSESQNRIGSLVMGGMSGDEANKTVFKENFKQILYEGVLGGIAGGIMTGVGAAINTIAERNPRSEETEYTVHIGNTFAKKPNALKRIVELGINNENPEVGRMVEDMQNGTKPSPLQIGEAVKKVVATEIEKNGGMMNILNTIAALEGRGADYIGSQESIDTAKAVMNFVRNKATNVDKALISRSDGATILLTAIEKNPEALKNIKDAAKTELRETTLTKETSVSDAESDSHTIVRDSDVFDKDGMQVTISDKSDVQNGVVVNGESKRMKETDSKGYSVAEKLATDLKKPVKFVKGLYDADGKMLDGVETDSGIFINTEAKNPIKWAATHEFSHTMKKSAGEAWSAYQNFVINKLKKQSSDIKGLNEYEKRYLIKKRDYAEHEINEEIAADYIGELFDSVDELAKFIKKDRGLAVKVRDIYYKALDKLGLLDEKKKAQQLWRDAYKKAVGNVEKGKVESKFELDKNVETTKDLLAIHNLTESQLIEAIKQKGIIMPSVAITNKGLSSFGDISVVFNKESIDPEENAANKMYGADAWTPQQTTLKLNPKFDDAKTRAFVNSIKNTIGENSDQIFDVDAEQFKKTVENAKGSLFNAYAQDIGMQTAYALDSGLIDSIPTEFGRINQDALREELDSKLDKDVVWRKYKKWLGDISNDIITSYDKASRQDIMESMTRQPESAKRFNLTVDGELTVPAVEYSSVDEARKNKGRLSETAEADAKKVGESFVEWANKLSAKSGVELNRIVKAVNTNFDNRYDIEGIRDNFNENGIPMTRTDANNLQRLYKDAVELPTLYFEAKPHRFVSTEEIAWVVLPNNANNSLKALLKENSITYKEYKSGDEQSRIDVLNSLEGVKFSRRTAENKGENKKSISGTRLTEISSDMYKTMEEHFGTTNNFDVAGYLLTDGKMLDFSGKHWGDDNSDFRQVDHRDIQEVLEDDNNGKTAMVDMITHGNIRLMPENGGINLSQMPNEKQVSVLREYINHFRGEVIVDIDNADGKTIHSFEYGKRTSPSRIISDISNYFTEGIIPEKTKSDLAEFRYSRSGTRASEISDSLKDENARLRRELENAHIQLNQAEGKGIDVKEVKRVAQDFRKQYGSKVRLSELHQDLTKLYNLMQSDKATADEVSQRISEIADKVIDNATQTVTNDEYSELLDRIKNTKIMVPELERADFRDGYETFRKRNMGKITLVNNGTDLDVFWDELTEEYPNLFDEDILGSEERLERILEVREEFAPREESVFTSDAEKEQARVKLKNDIMNAFYDIPEGESGTKYVFYDKRVADVEKELADTSKKLNLSNKKTIRAGIDSDFNYLSQMLKNPTDNKHIPENMRAEVAALLRCFNYETKYLDKLKDAGKEADSPTAVRISDMYRTYTNIIKASWGIENTEQQFVDQFLSEDLKEMMGEIPVDESGGFKRLEDMSIDELRSMAKVLRSVHHTITQRNKAFNTAIKEEISELGFNAAEDFKSTRARRKGSGEKVDDNDTVLEKAVQVVDKYFNYDNIQPWDFFHEMGGTMERLFMEERKGFDKHILNLKSAAEAMQKATEGIDLDKVTGKGAPKIRFKTSFNEELVLSKGQILSLYALYNRKQGKEHILGGGIVTGKKYYNADGQKGSANTAHPITEADLGKLFDENISSEEKKMVKAVVEFMSKECAKWGNETSMKLYGYEKFGESWYFPIKVSDQTLNTYYGEKGEGNQRTQGFTKKTTKNASNAVKISDFFDTVTSHINGVSLYNSTALPMLDMERVLNYNESGSNVKVRADLIRTFGKNAEAYIEKFHKDENGSTKTEKSGLEKLVSLNKKASIGFNARVLVQQPTSIARAYMFLSPKDLPASFKGAAMIKEMREVCPIAYWKSLGFRDIGTGSSLKTVLLDNESLYSKAEMGLYGLADDFTWGLIYGAVKNETIRKNPDLKVGSKEFNEKVRDRFNYIVDRTQVVDSVFHRTQNMRSDNALVKNTTMFMSEALKTYNLYRTEMKDAVKEKRKFKTAARATAVFAASNLLLALVQAFPDAWREDDEKELFDKKGNPIGYWGMYWKKFKEDLLDDVNPLNSFPIIKDVWGIVQGFRNERVEYSRLNDFIISCKNLGNNKMSLPAKWINFTTSAAAVFGVSALNLKRDVFGLVETIFRANGEEYNDYLIDKFKFNVKSDSNKAKFMRHYERAMANGHADDAAIILEDYMAETFKGKDFNNEHTEAVTEEASKLLGKTDDDSKLIYSLPSEKFSLDGEETKIPDKDYPEFVEGYYNTLYDLAYEMVTDERYKNLSDEDKVRSFGDIESYAKATQLSEMFDGYDLTGWKEKVYDGETKFMDSVFERVADREFSDKKESYLDGLNFDESKYSEAELGIVEDVENKWAGYKASKDLGREIDESKYRHIIVYEDKLSNEMPLEEYAGVRAYAKKTAALYDLNDADESKGTEALTAKELEQYLDSTDYSQETKAALFMAIGNSNWYNKYTGLKNNGEPRKSSGGGGGSSGGKSFSRGNSKSSTRSSSGGSTRSTRTTRTTIRRSNR